MCVIAKDQSFTYDTYLLKMCAECAQGTQLMVLRDVKHCTLAVPGRCQGNPVRGAQREM